MSEIDTGTAENKPQFAMQRIFLRDASFESPAAPNSFRTEWQPKINLEINTRHALLEDTLWEVVLALTVTVKNQDEEVMYLAEVHQSGIFHIDGLEGEQMAHTLGSFCPNVLFPYAREAIDSMITKGSFPALMLAPVNFDAIYEQSKLAKAQQENQVN